MNAGGLAEIVQLDEVRREHEERRDLVVALDPALLAFLSHQELRRWRRRDRGVRYVASDQVPEGTRPDIVIGRYVPSAPGRRFLLQTFEHLYDVDAAGRVFRDGEVVWSEPLASIGAPRSWLPGQVRIGEEAALLFVSRESDGWHFRIYVTATPVIIAAGPPAPCRQTFVPRDWLNAALHALPEAPEYRSRSAAE